MRVFALTIIFLVLAMALSSCQQAEVTQEQIDQATMSCIRLCQTYTGSDLEKSKGPCISNSIEPDWVCDIAHSPRILIDNEPENQCTAFRDGIAHHFVEVDENCDLIRTY